MPRRFHVDGSRLPSGGFRAQNSNGMHSVSNVGFAPAQLRDTRKAPSTSGAFGVCGVGGQRRDREGRLAVLRAHGILAKQGRDAREGRTSAARRHDHRRRGSEVPLRARVPRTQGVRRVGERRLEDRVEGSVDHGNELDAQPGSPRLVPFRGRRQLSPASGRDPESGHVRPRRFKIRERASVQSLPLSPRPFAASTRRSSSPSHAASHPVSRGPSTLAMISDASSSRSSSGRVSTSCRSV